MSPIHRTSSGRVGETRPFRRFSAKVATLLALACVAVALLGCSTPDATSREDEVRTVVTRYNRVLAEGYRTMDMSRLRQVSEQLQAEDEYIHMSALGEGGVRLLPTLTKREFLDVSVEATSAQVQTRERWDYIHEDVKTREIVLEQKGLIYEMAWDLVLHDDGRWYVSDVRAMATTETAPPRRFSTPTRGSGRF